MTQLGTTKVARPILLILLRIKTIKQSTFFEFLIQYKTIKNKKIYNGIFITYQNKSSNLYFNCLE